MEQSTGKINIVGQVSHFFTTHRPLSILILITSLVFGLVSFVLTPKQYNPEIKRPAFAISLQYKGATIEESLERVVYEMVEKVGTVPGVDDIYTQVTDGAQIQTTVIFEVGYDTTKAKVDLTTQLHQHSYLARGFISVPTIIEINPETVPVLQVVFGSDTLTLVELREKVVKLSQALTQVEDVSDVSVKGGLEQALVVELDPAKLLAQSVSTEEVIDVLGKSQTRSVMRGVVHDPYQIEVVYDARSNTPEEVGGREVKDGVLVRDVAHVYLGSDAERTYVLHRSKESGFDSEVVMLSVAKVEGSSAPVVTEHVREEIQQLLVSPEYDDMQYKVVGDDGATASREIQGLTKNLITSIVIVAMVLFLFLSVRAALVVLVAIPLTLLIVFGLGYLFGETINRITLFALILSLGLLVDSAIVVVENIYTHIKEGHKSDNPKTREQLIARAVHEIGIGLLLSTVTSIIVFLPMRYITGMMGPYMGPIAFFVPTALIVSLLVAIVVTPFVASHLLRGDEKETRVSLFVNKYVERVTNKYAQFLKAIVYSRKKQTRLLFGALVLFSVSLLLPATGLVHFQMLPRADQNQFYMYFDGPTGTGLESTRRSTEALTQFLSEHEEVLSVQSFVATAPILDFNGLFKGAQNRIGTNQSTLRVNISPSQERRVSSSGIVSELRHTFEEKYPELAEDIQFIEEPPGPPVRATFVAKVLHKEEEVRTHFADMLTLYMKEVEGVEDVHIHSDDAVGRVVYTLNHDALREFGVTQSTVEQSLSLMQGGVEVSEFSSAESSEYTPLVASFVYAQRSAPASIDTLYVQNTRGESVPLSAVLETTYEARPSVVTVEDGALVTYVTAEVENRSIVYVVLETLKGLIAGTVSGYEVEHWSLFSMSLVDEKGVSVELVWGGEWEMTLENFRDLGIAMGVALMLVYAVLVAQYNRFSTPAFILVTVPLGLVGILWGFFVLDSVFGIYLTATALIGFIALIGLVVNNAIIYLEYVEQERKRGVSFQDALVEAGKARLRPIALTSFTTILGSLTIAGDPVWSGLAWAIVFGLSLSTILTLVVYPTLLVFFTNKPLQNN